MSMEPDREKIQKIFREGFLNYTGYTSNEIDMKKLEQAPHRKLQPERVSRDDWENLPMPPDSLELPYTRRFTPAEYRKLSFGLLPVDMDEKWFIFYEGAMLFFHRSWTGECSFQLRLEPEGEDYLVRETRMNPALNFQEDGYPQKFLDYLIDRLLLSKAVPFPFPKHIQAPLERALFRHALVGSSVANDEGGHAADR
ncbi:MAG: hypothetical protein AB1439_08165 [candidate division FCPU426 bacterium]